MRVIALVVAGLACLVHGRRVQTLRSSLPRSLYEERNALQRSVSRFGVSDHLKEFVKLLLALDNPTTGWQVIMQSRNLASQSAIGRARDRRRGRWICMQAVEEEEAKTDEQPKRQTAATVEELAEAEEIRMNRPPASFPGTDLTVTEYPHPILRAPNKDVTEFDDKLKTLADDMFKVMYGCSGVGVAAPQVGHNLNMFVYNWQPQYADMRAECDIVVCNPKIIKYSAETDIEPEGCLSIAGMVCRGNVRRAMDIEVEYQDLEGRVKKEVLNEFRARVFQHECDHLNGVLIFDRYFKKEKKIVQPYLDVMVNEYGPDGVPELDKEARTSLQPPPGDVELNRLTRRKEEKAIERLATERREKGQQQTRIEVKEKSDSGFGGGGKGGASKGKNKKKKTKKKR